MVKKFFFFFFFFFPNSPVLFQAAGLAENKTLPCSLEQHGNAMKTKHF